MNNKETVSREQYDNLLEKYNEVNKKLKKLENRKIIKITNKMIKISKKIKLYKPLKYMYKGFRKISRLPKYKENQFRKILSKDKLSLEEYKYYRYKKNRVNNYYIDSSKIRHKHEKDLVSIVIPIYNDEKYLNQTLDSILNQTYKNIEIIIVNDITNDKALDIVNKYQIKDKKIKIINKDTEELSVALTKGFNEINGEYATWVNSGDILHNNCIELLVNEMKSNACIDFVFSNIRLIDENNNLVDSNFYSNNQNHTDYVKFSHNMLKYCIIKNNSISPVALYKSLLIKTLSPFSRNRLTVENYDFSMRANDLFMMKHTDYEGAIYDYRIHNNFLSNQTESLNISQYSDFLIYFERFRESYYLMPFIWIIKDGEFNELRTKILEHNHLIITPEKVQNLKLNNIYKNAIYITSNCNDKLDDLYNVFINDNQKLTKGNFDLYITTNINNDIKLIDNQKGYFGISDTDILFNFIDTKAKEYYLSKIEDYVMSNNKEKLKLSAIICTYKRSDILINAIQNLLNQTEDRNNFEILIINNDINSNDVFDIVDDIKQKNNLSDEFIRYVEAPIKGLSYARNTGMYEARGDILLYLDDDSLADKNNVKEIINAFENNPNAGVVGGNIILVKPNPLPDVLIENTENLWSQFIIKGDDYITVDSWNKYPYGANYAVKKEDALKVGGFNLSYGRKGHNVLGGEELVLSSAIKELGKDIVLAPKAIVNHKVDKDRFNKEHVKKKNCSSPTTRMLMEQDLAIPPKFQNYNMILSELKTRKKNLKNMKDRMKRYYAKTDVQGSKILIKAFKKTIKERVNGVKYREDNLSFLDKQQ